MRLFSTILDINKTLTAPKFIELLIKWNQNSPRPGNIIEGFDHAEEMPFKFGTDNHYIGVEKYEKKGIIAAKYVNATEDEITKSMEFIVNFEQLKISIVNDWSYSEEVLKNDARLMAPNFITYLIDGGYLKEDVGLPILHDPIYVSEENIETVAKIINGESVYKLPVVYVSKKRKDGEDPLDVDILSGWLRGVAHVFVEDNIDVSNALRKLCDDKNAYNGAVAIYYPNAAPKKINSRSKYSLRIKVAQNVIDYVKLQEIPDLYTLGDIKISSLFDELQEATENQDTALQLADSYLKDSEDLAKTQETLGKKIKELEKEVNNLSRDKNELLEVIGEMQKSTDDAKPLIYYGEEEEYLEGEILEIVMEALEQGLRSHKEIQRRYIVLKDIIENNEYPKTLIENQKKMKQILRTYKRMTEPLKKELKEMGFEIERQDNHYVFKYHNRDDLQFVMSKTTGAQESGLLSASEINTVLF